MDPALEINFPDAIDTEYDRGITIETGSHNEGGVIIKQLDVEYTQLWLKSLADPELCISRESVETNRDVIMNAECHKESGVLTEELDWEYTQLWLGSMSDPEQCTKKENSLPSLQEPGFGNGASPDSCHSCDLLCLNIHSQPVIQPKLKKRSAEDNVETKTSSSYISVETCLKKIQHSDTDNDFEYLKFALKCKFCLKPLNDCDRTLKTKLIEKREQEKCDNSGYRIKKRKQEKCDHSGYRMNRKHKVHSCFEKEKNCHKCQHCKYVSCFPHNIKKHIQSNNCKNSERELCVYRSDDEDKLQSQTLTRTGEKYSCELFGKLHTGEKCSSGLFGNLHTCEKCSCELYGKSHTGEKYLCELCGKPHTGEKYSCDLCGQRLSDKSNLNRHMSLHNDKRELCCEHCGYIAANMNNLTRHMYTHFDDKPHMCQHCGLRVSDASSLKRHIRTHTGENKSHVCARCGYKTSRKYRLLAHIRWHNNDYRFVCEKCGFRAKDADAWNKHTKVHTSSGSYKCFMCDYKVNHKGNLKRHMHRKHTSFECV